MPSTIITLSRNVSRKVNKLQDLSSLVKNFNLTFTLQEVLHNQLIALDSVKRKLLIISKVSGRVVCRIVNLKYLQHCSVEKVYSNIQAGALREKKLEEYLKTVSLKLYFKYGMNPMTVQFYGRKNNNVQQLPFLLATANKWADFMYELLSGRNERILN